MPKQDDGGPAFPITWDEVNESGNRYPVVFNGMTLRDYFAAQALIGLHASHNATSDPDVAARRAYGMADAMLAARQA